MLGGPKHEIQTEHFAIHQTQELARDGVEGICLLFECQKSSSAGCRYINHMSFLFQNFCPKGLKTPVSASALVQVRARLFSAT